jgi:hypothetical protein
MKPKNSEDIKDKLMSYTPYAMYFMIHEYGMKNNDELMRLAFGRIKKSEKELDEILNIKKEFKYLELMLLKVSKWVEDNGGNSNHILKFATLTKHMDRYSKQGKKEEVTIYDENTITSYIKLLRQFALDEVSNNNKEFLEYHFG